MKEFFIQHSFITFSRFNGHTENVEGICFSSDGQLIASGSWCTTVRIWDTATGKCLRVLKRHSASIGIICFSSDAKLLASGIDDMTIHVWDISTGKCLRVLKRHTSVVLSVCFHPHRRNISA